MQAKKKIVEIAYEKCEYEKMIFISDVKFNDENIPHFLFLPVRCLPRTRLQPPFIFPQPPLNPPLRYPARHSVHSLP